MAVWWMPEAGCGRNIARGLVLSCAIIAISAQRIRARHR